MANSQFTGIKISGNTVSDAIWEELKAKNGIYKEREMDFIVWTDELEETEYTQDTLDYVNTVLDANPTANMIHFQ